MSRWCLNVLDQKLSKAQVDEKLERLRAFAERKYPTNGRFRMSWFANVVREIDRLWYNRRLLKELTQAYGGLHLFVDVDEPAVAGYVLESDDRTSIALHMNRSLFERLFTKRERGYHSGGLLCTDRLDCMLHVLLHETVHLVLTLCEKLDLRPDVREHSKAFNRTVRSLFGQTDPQHGLIPGYDQSHSLEQLKRCVKADKRVEIFFKGKWIPGSVRSVSRRKWVEVECAGRKFYTVHIGLIRFPRTT